MQFDSSLVFIPQKTKPELYKTEKINEKLILEGIDGRFLEPPGLGLSLLFEKELGVSFMKQDLEDLYLVLPKILIEHLDIAENVEINTEENIITIQITNSIFNTICQETRPRTHAQVGCLLTSALACILAKTTGKPITIQNETYSPENKITAVKYRIEEE